MKVVKLKALGERGDTLNGEQPKIKVEAEEYNENSTVVVDESLTLKFEENVKAEPEDCSINVEKMTIEDIKKMIRDISNENKTLRKSLQAKCKNNDMKKAKLRTMSKQIADLETKVKKTEQERDLAKENSNKFEQYSASLYRALSGNFDNPDSMTGYPANQGKGDDDIFAMYTIVSQYICKRVF